MLVSSSGFKSNTHLNASVDVDIKKCLFLISGYYSTLSKKYLKNKLLKMNLCNVFEEKIIRMKYLDFFTIGALGLRLPCLSFRG
jgi:hypothetical protein